MLEFVPIPEPNAVEQDRLIEELAQKIHKYGLEVPAIFMGELMKPASFILGQLTHSFGFVPAAYGIDERMLEQFAFILDDRQQLEKLIVRLEELAKER